MVSQPPVINSRQELVNFATEHQLGNWHEPDEVDIAARYTARPGGIGIDLDNAMGAGYCYGSWDHGGPYAELFVTICRMDVEAGKAVYGRDLAAINLATLLRIASEPGDAPAPDRIIGDLMRQLGVDQPEQLPRALARHIESTEAARKARRKLANTVSELANQVEELQAQLRELRKVGVGDYLNEGRPIPANVIEVVDQLGDRWRRITPEDHVLYGNAMEYPDESDDTEYTWRTTGGFCTDEGLLMPVKVTEVR